MPLWHLFFSLKKLFVEINETIKSLLEISPEFFDLALYAQVKADGSKMRS